MFEAEHLEKKADYYGALFDELTEYISYAKQQKRKSPNKPMQIDSARAVRLHEYSYLAFYHANGHRMHCD